MGNLRTGSRILVVDDETTLREVISRRLRRAGYVVTAAPNADVAMELTQLGRPPFDLVISDVHMPGMSGLDLAMVLIERRPAQRIIIMTSDPDEMLRRAALARGPVHFLLKPFELFELEAAVEQALATQRFMVTPPPSAQRAYRQAAIGTIAAKSLLWVDEQSQAGRGHGDRVARMARTIGKSMTQPFTAFELAELEVAAWSHEIALLAGAVAHPIEMAWRSANMLEANGANELVCQFVRHMHERWDGSGGPEGLVGDAIPLGAQILSAVDTIDHYCAAWVQSGMRAELAAHRSIDLVVSQQGGCFSPEIVDLVNRNLDALRSICGVARINLTLEAIA